MIHLCFQPLDNSEMADNIARLSGFNSGDTIVDDYDIIRILGKGGMGIVALVKDRLTGHLYAVKRVLANQFESITKRRDFLRELLTWSEAPDHPNIAPFRFFRSINDEIYIFSDYIAGGSLHDWIYEGKIQSIDQILEIAIRSAWGIQAAHDRNIIHQDIKPKNILMTPEGIPRITDFGLARIGIRKYTRGMRPGSGDDTIPQNPPSSASTGVSTGGFTPAYCSPEQAEGMIVTPRSDLWNWAVTVMEMFANERVMEWGFLAKQALDRLITDGPVRRGSFPMTRAVGDIMGKCLEMNSKARWHSIGIAADRLNDEYYGLTGQRVSRPATQINSMSKNPRKTPVGSNWIAPLDFLNTTGRVVKDSPVRIEQQCATFKSTRAYAISDLVFYDEILDVSDTLPTRDDDSKESIKALVLDQIVLILWTLGDIPGALSACNRAIALRGLSKREQSLEQLTDMAESVLTKATILCTVRLFDKAIPASLQAEDLFNKVISEEKTALSMSRLARVLMHRANAVKAMGQNAASIALYDRSDVLLSEVIAMDPQSKYRQLQSNCRMNKANSLRASGRFEEAIRLYTESADLLEACRDDPMISDGEDRALVALNCASTRMSVHQFDEAIDEFERAISIYERLDPGESDYPLQMDRALAIVNKANTLMHLGRPAESITLYAIAIRIRSRWLFDEGRREVAGSLATAFINLAIIQGDVMLYRESLTTIQKAINILEPLVCLENESTKDVLLVKCYLHRVTCLYQCEEYLAFADDVIRVEGELKRMDGKLPSDEIEVDLAQLTVLHYLTQRHGTPARFTRDEAWIAMDVIRSSIESGDPLGLKGEYETLKDRLNTESI